MTETDPRSVLRVLVAEDHPVVRAGLVALLDAAEGIEVRAQAADGPSAVTAAQRVRVDVALVDVRMPGATGIEVTPALRRTGARVLAISAFALDTAVLDALAAGADGYLVKTEAPERILEAVRAVGAGDAVLSAAVTRTVLASMGPRGLLAPTERDEPPSLTPREEDVLRLLAEGCSNQEISERLFVEVTTVKSHITHVLAKLGVTSRVQAALWWQRHRQGPVRDVR